MVRTLDLRNLVADFGSNPAIASIVAIPLPSLSSDIFRNEAHPVGQPSQRAYRLAKRMRPGVEGESTSNQQPATAYLAGKSRTSELLTTDQRLRPRLQVRHIVCGIDIPGGQLLEEDLFDPVRMGLQEVASPLVAFQAHQARP